MADRVNHDLRPRLALSKLELSIGAPPGRRPVIPESDVLRRTEFPTTLHLTQS